MRPLPPLARIGLAAAVVGLASLATAVPAGAREPESPHAEATPSLPGVVNIASDATEPKPVTLTVANSSTNAARDVSVKIDASALPASIAATLPGTDQGCTVTGAVSTCTLAELAAGKSQVYTIGVAPGNLDETPWNGTLTVTSGAENTTEEATAESVVQVSSPGVDLVIGDIADVELAPGASADVPITARNEGTVAADAVAVVLSTSRYLELPNPYSNCEFNEDDLSLTCVLDGTVAPGESFAIDSETPLRVKVADTAPGPDSYAVSASVLPLRDDEASRRLGRAERSGGQELRLVAASEALRAPAEDLNDQDNATEFDVLVPLHRADSVAVGANVEGAIGETKDVKVGIRNDGPANTLTPGEEWGSSAQVVLPAGLTVTKVDEQCEPSTDNPTGEDRRGKVDGLAYRCWPSEHLTAGSTWLFDFTVEISGEPGAAGSIVVDGGVQDSDTANNTAPITLGAGGGGAGLPVTGARTGVIAAVGALLLVTGVVGVVVGRRRRVGPVGD